MELSPPAVARARAPAAPECPGRRWRPADAALLDVACSASADVWAGAALSKSGKCFMIKETSTAGTTFGSATPCTGAQAVTSATAGDFPSS